MDGTQFKKLIQYYGEDNILGILFDNSASKIFSKGEFTLVGSYIEELESLQFVEFDNRLRPYHIVKSVEDIQGVIVRDQNISFDSYDRADLRG